MGLFGKIFLLVVAQIVLMVTCVYMHVDLFSSHVNEQEQKISQKTIALQKQTVDGPVLQKVVSDANLTNKTTPQTKTTEPIIKKIEEVKEIKAVSKQEVSKNEQDKNTPTITDEKVKALFKQKNIKPTEEKIVATPSTNEKSLLVEKAIAQVLSQNKIIFKRLSTDVTHGSMKTIEQIAEILQRYPDVNIEVGGHTDAKGDDEVNAYISKHRALSVRKLLIQMGINKERLSAKGYGESQPIVKNDPQGYSVENRRVEFKVIKE